MNFQKFVNEQQKRLIDSNIDEDKIMGYLFYDTIRNMNYDDHLLINAHCKYYEDKKTHLLFCGEENPRISVDKLKELVCKYFENTLFKVDVVYGRRNIACERIDIFVKFGDK